ELCSQLKDPSRNGGKTINQIIEHVTSDKLVGWGWNPGEGRATPPLSRPEFAAKMQEWARNGAACPQ
ncbi:MAG TPA: Isoquinoline 1-oxidoreductase subunit, partial [Acidobacteriota bacterium]